MNKQFLRKTILGIAFLSTSASFACTEDNCYGIETLLIKNETSNVISSTTKEECVCSDSTIGFSNLKPGEISSNTFKIDKGRTPACVFRPSFVTITYTVDGQEIGWSKFYKYSTGPAGKFEPCNYAISTNENYTITCQSDVQGSNSTAFIAIKNLDNHRQ